MRRRGKEKKDPARLLGKEGKKKLYRSRKPKGVEKRNQGISLSL